jgi:hypothetical protein
LSETRAHLHTEIDSLFIPKPLPGLLSIINDRKDPDIHIL